MVIYNNVNTGLPYEEYDHHHKIHERFWLEDLSVLFNHFRFVPTYNMNKSAKLNAVTRLCIVVGAVLYFMKVDWWLYFILASLLGICMIKYSGAKIENFSVTPTYGTGNVLSAETRVVPTYAEEWQLNPHVFDQQKNYITPQVELLSTGYPSEQIGAQIYDQTPPVAYPYGQVLSRTNMMPTDEHVVLNNRSSKMRVRDYANSAFLRNDLAFRHNMIEEYKKKLNRRFRHNCNNIFNPRYSD